MFSGREGEGSLRYESIYVKVGNIRCIFVDQGLCGGHGIEASEEEHEGEPQQENIDKLCRRLIHLVTERLLSRENTNAYKVLLDSE